MERLKARIGKDWERRNNGQRDIFHLCRLGYPNLGFSDEEWAIVDGLG